jgi:hypothetical protein
VAVTAIRVRAARAPDRREDYGGVEGFARPLVRSAGPDGAERAGEGLAIGIARPGEGEDPAAVVDRELGDDVGRSTEAIDAQGTGAEGLAVGAVADQPGAEQRRRLQIAVALGQGEAVVRLRLGIFGIAAIGLVAGEGRCVAKVLAAGAAIGTNPASASEPGDADALAGREAGDAVPQLLDRTDDFVSRHDRQLRVGQLAVDDVQVGAADAAGAHLHDDLAGSGSRPGHFDQSQRLAGPLQAHGSHRRLLSARKAMILTSIVRLRTRNRGEAGEAFRRRLIF